jgi:GNAT superfamily N-acetyltransferase
MADASVHVRPMRRDDIAAGLRLCRAASWNQVASDWDLFLAASPHGCRVATTAGGEIVGSVATINYGDVFSWIAMVLVHPAYRRAGIGTELLKEALAILGDRTARLDATPAGLGVYVPLGFREESGLQRMTRPAPATPKPASGGTSAVRRMTDSDFGDVLKHDLDVFGADRRMLLHMLRREAPEYACVIGSDSIHGYMFGRHGHEFEHIGPIVAHDASAAGRLVSSCLAQHDDRPFVIDVPLRSSWVGRLEAEGFVIQRPFIRMCRGARRFDERPEEIFAIAGPEFG